jgi:hypothetical protein
VRVRRTCNIRKWYCKRPIVGSRSNFTFGFENPHSLQICTPPTFPNYDPRRKIEESLHSLKQTRSETKNWLQFFLKEKGILYSLSMLKTMLLTNSKNDNFKFFQGLK